MTHPQVGLLWELCQKLKLIEVFLVNHKEWVVVDGEQLLYLNIKSSVPQGVTLGPALLVIYIIDMPDTVKSSICIYTDDGILYRQSKSKADCNEH